MCDRTINERQSQVVFELAADPPIGHVNVEIGVVVHVKQSHSQDHRAVARNLSAREMCRRRCCRTAIALADHLAKLFPVIPEQVVEFVQIVKIIPERWLRSRLRPYARV